MHWGTIIGRVYVYLCVQLGTWHPKLFRGVCNVATLCCGGLFVELGFSYWYITKGNSQIFQPGISGQVKEVYGPGMTASNKLGRNTVISPLEMHWFETVLP